MPHPKESVQRLNLPPIEPRLRRDPAIGMMIHDRLRDKFVALTPEEWVRQHFTAYLIETLGYPAPRMANEMGVKLNGMTRRCDTVVFDRRACPWMVVEYKAPSVRITAEVFNQAVRYCMVLRPPYIAVSNGLRHYCCRVHYSPLSIEMLPEFPIPS